MPRKTKSVAAAKVSAPELFVKISAEGKELPITAKKWEAVKHIETGLLFPAELPPSGSEAPWAEAIKKPAQSKLAGRCDWRAASPKEAIHAVDHTKHSPAFDTRFFRYPKYGWLWLSIPSAAAPAGSAWSLSLYYGGAYISSQHSQGLALAVCGPVASAGQ